MQRKRASSKDVAREAGVSQATVSYVLNDVKNVKIRPETRQAVLDAVKKLNYHPSHIARGMKWNRSMSVGVITDRRITNYNFMETLEGIRDGLSQSNYSITLLFNKSDDSFNMEILDYYNTNRLDGVIFAFATVDELSREELNQNGVPYVIVDSHVSHARFHEIGTDHLCHLTDLTALFRKRGASRLAYTGPRWKCGTDFRLKAFEQAVQESGLHNLGCFLCPFRDDQIRDTVGEMLRSPERPDGIITGSPRFGFSVLKAAAEMGKRVPEDLMVASLGASAFYHLCHPAMTAVELPLYEMGRRSAAYLMDLLNDRPVEDTIILPSEIVMRASL
ncbi:LacI family DNA-binding transcriptional regulator [Eubacteriales bacterium mix99]|jgi:DNA-binding LacI/PurR family transcriptional regulator